MGRLLDTVSPPMLVLLVVSLFGLTATATWLYGFKRPVAERERLRGELEMLAVVDDPATLQRTLDAAREELATVERRLHGDAPPLAARQMVAYLLGELDRRARRHGVRLLSVTPAAASEVLEFREWPFVIEVVGSYFDIYGWLRDVEAGIGAMVVKQFEISPDASADDRRMVLTMAAYRPLEDS